MRKINGKLFLYELKKTFLIPAIFATLFLIISFIDLFFYDDPGTLASGYDNFAKGALYVFS